jgi:hypothetical protein
MEHVIANSATSSTHGTELVPLTFTPAPSLPEPPINPAPTGGPRFASSGTC